MENYNIITLGASGAGKTVFLASLFKELSLPTDEGIYLKVKDVKQKQDLNSIYTQVANKESWPVGTIRKVTKWQFTCCVRSQDFEAYPVCQFTYLDYGGGILTDLTEEGLSDFTYNFHKEIPNADAVIVLIDGGQLYKYISSGYNLSDPGIASWLLTDLPSTIQLAHEVKDNPLHFVITKWDLLEENYDLSEVRECLESRCMEFKRLVDLRVRAKFPVRLIPISSVGKEFVTMQSDGSMKKNLGNVPKPFQLEIPISYVLIDKVAAYYNNVDQKNKDFEKSVQHKLAFLLDLIPDAVKRGKLLTREQRIQRLRKVNNATTAFSYLIETFAGHIKEFEIKYPEGNLGGDIKMPILQDVEDEDEDEDKDSTTFTCNQEQFNKLTQNLKTWLDKQGYNHQTMKTEDDATLIQIAKKGLLRQVTGMSQALNIQLTHRKHNLKVKLFGGKWLDKAGFAAAGSLIFAPLLFTAGVGAWQQSRLPKKIINFISDELT